MQHSSSLMTTKNKPNGRGQLTRWTGGTAEFQQCQSGPVTAWRRKPGSVVTTGGTGAHHDLPPGRSGEFNSIIRSRYERYIRPLDRFYIPG